MNQCKVNECNKYVHGNGYCSSHNYKFKAYGDPLHAGKWRKVCSLDNCNEKHEAKGYCIKHYERFLKHNDPHKSLHTEYCRIVSCGKKHKAKGFCVKHYARIKKKGEITQSIFDLSPQERLMSKMIINRETQCWEWQGCTIKDNYGMMVLNNIQHLTHRLSYELFFGEFDKELCVCHKCDNPICINPDHLFLGTHQDNMTDMKNKGRAYSPLKNKEH